MPSVLMIFEHRLPPAQEQPRAGSGGDLSTWKNTWEGIFLFLKCALTEVVPAPWLCSAVAVLGPLELLAGASPAAPLQKNPEQRALLRRAAPSPCPKSSQVSTAKEIDTKPPCRWPEKAPQEVKW